MPRGGPIWEAADFLGMSPEEGLEAATRAVQMAANVLSLAAVVVNAVSLGRRVEAADAAAHSLKVDPTFRIGMSILFSSCGLVAREHGSREHCASQACRNEISPHCIVFQLASSGAPRYRRSSRERTSYLDCICHRSFRRMSFCSGDEGGALEYLIKLSKARTTEVAPALA
jgi:hypothetical protein